MVELLGSGIRYRIRGTAMGKRFQIACAVAGLALMWPYLQHFFFRVTFFGNISVFDSLIGFGVFLVVVGAVIAVAALKPSAVVRLLARPRVMLAIAGLSLAGSVCIVVTSGSGEGPFFAAFTLLCVVCYAAGFAALFFAWVFELKRLVFRLGLGTAVSIVVVSAALGYTISPTWIADTWFYRLLPVLGIPLSSGCWFVLARRFPFEPSECNPVLQSPSVKRWGLLFVAYFIINMMHALFYCIDQDADFTGDTVLSFAVLFVFMALLLIMALNKHMGQNSLWYLGVGLTVVLFAGLFFAFQFGSSDAVLGMSIVFTIMRCLQIFVFVVLLVVVYQDDLPALPLFGAVFLLTMVFSSVFSYFIAPWWIEAFDIDASASVGAFATVLGFLLIVVLAAFLLFFSSGTNLHAVTYAREPAPSAMDRESACQELARRHGMTQREQDVLCYVSLGYNVKKIGETLFISEHTVHSHAKAVYRKLDVHAKQEVIDLVNGMCR